MCIYKNTHKNDKRQDMETTKLVLFIIWLYCGVGEMRDSNTE